MANRLCRGDQVVAIAGNDKGKVGKVLAAKGQKVVVEGLNVRKKCVKPTQENPKGQIVEVERPFNISNVAPCGESGKPLKLKMQVGDDGSRALIDRDGNVYRTLRKGKSK